MHNILLAQNSAIVTLDIIKSLTSLNCKIINCFTADKALELAGTHKPDIFLTSVDLTQRWERIKAAKEIEKKLNIPVGFISGYKRNDIEGKLKELNNYIFIQKPFTKDELEKGIRTLISMITVFLMFLILF